MRVTYYSPEEVYLNPEMHRYLPEWAEPGEYALVTGTEGREGEKAFALVIVTAELLKDAYNPRAIIEGALRDALDRLWNDHEKETS